MSKFATFNEYPKDSLATVEKALLTVWPSLERYHDDLVLVGGMAVHYLTKSVLADLPGRLQWMSTLPFRLAPREANTVRSRRTWADLASNPRVTVWYAGEADWIFTSTS